MGVPVSGKNMFPSNIAGLPTWFTIRANKDGYIARKKEIDFLVAMNAETAQDDVKSLAPGAVVLYDEPLNLNQVRNDLVFYSRAVRQAGRAGLPRSQTAQAGQEHDLRGRSGEAAVDRHGRGRKGHRASSFPAKPKAANSEFRRRQGRLRLRHYLPDQAGSVRHRAHGQDRGQDHHRRQLRRRSGLHVCRSHGRDLVSHHAVVLAGRNPDRIHEGIPHRPRRQSHLRHRAGGRRTGCHRHGAGRRLGGSAIDDLHRWTRHFADGRVCRTVLLRRSSGSGLGHPARRSLHRASHAHLAGRHSLDRVSVARRHQAHHADSVFGRRVFRAWRGTPSIWPNNSRLWCS